MWAGVVELPALAVAELTRNIIAQNLATGQWGEVDVAAVEDCAIVAGGLVGKLLGVEQGIAGRVFERRMGVVAQDLAAGLVVEGGGRIGRVGVRGLGVAWAEVEILPVKGQALARVRQCYIVGLPGGWVFETGLCVVAQ